MKLQDQVNATCGECGGRKEIIQHEMFGCDWCGTDMAHDKGHLRASVFRYEGDRHEEKDLQFCAWSCAFAKLKTVKSDYFATLPYLYFEESTPRPQSVRSFLKLVDWTAVAENAGKKMGRASKKGRK